MGIEKQALHLRPHSIQEIPLEFRDLHTLVMSGFTLAQVAQGLKESARNGRFAKLARYLIFLGERGFFLDTATQNWVESLRPDHNWPESIVFEELFGFELFRLRKTAVDGSAKVLTIANLLFLGGWAVYVLLRSSWSGFSSGGTNSPWEWLWVFVVVFCLGKSARAFGQWLVLRVSAGFPAALRFRVDHVSVSLATDDLSLSRGGEATLWGGLGALFCLTLPLALFSSSPLLPVATYSAQLLLLAELSPFVRSGLTEWLRLLYNYIATPGRTDEQSEAIFRMIHRTIAIVWTFSFLAFLAFTGRSAFRDVVEQMDLHAPSARIGAGVLAISQGIILFSMLNDVFSQVASQDLGPRRLARLWRRRPSSLSVDEAVAQGRMPIRAELAQLPLLRQLDADLRDELLAKARVVDFKPGQFACRQGANDRALYIVLSGVMVVAKSGKGRRRVLAFLESGAIFGEAAFFLNQPRTADVIATEPCRALEIQHHPSMRILDADRSEELRSRIWFLQSLVSNSTFRELPSEALDALIFAGREKKIPAGTHVMREGQDGDACYFLVQGQGSVVQNGRMISKVKGGDVIGEIALLKPLVPRTATVIADSELITIAITTHDFWELLSAHLPLAIEIERIAERRLAGDRLKKARPS